MKGHASISKEYDFIMMSPHISVDGLGRLQKILRTTAEIDSPSIDSMSVAPMISATFFEEVLKIEVHLLLVLCVYCLH